MKGDTAENYLMMPPENTPPATDVVRPSRNKNTDNNDRTHDRNKSTEYSVTDTPPVAILVTSALQHVMMCLPTNLAFTLIEADALCAPYDSPIRARLFATDMFMSGVCSLMQTFLGVRLPIFQGPSAAFFPTILSLQKNAIWTCGNSSVQGSSGSNLTGVDLDVEEKLRQLSGSLMAASLVEILVGATGLVGLVMRFVGPITVATTVILLGVSLIKIPIMYSKASWELALCGAVLAVIFGLYLRNKTLPVPTCQTGKRKTTPFHMFQLFPILLSIGTVWIISAILTATNVFPPDPDHPRYKARTDAKNNLQEMTPWFFFPYPGQFGLPSFKIAIFVGFITAFCASIVESVGDYLATARACHVTAPPNHAVNRGIMMEGIGGLLSGAVGLGHATTSLSQNLSVIALSKTSSRIIMVFAGSLLIVFAVVGKLGAAIATIPDPALGGVLLVLFGMLVSLGLSNLRHVNLDSSRNIIILGLSLFVGIFLPEWINMEEGLINTGNLEVDGVLKIALGTPMFLGGVLSLILDNTVSGTKKERGIIDHHLTPGNEDEDEDEDVAVDVYTWPCLTSHYDRVSVCAKLPFMPPLSRPSQGGYSVTVTMQDMNSAQS